MNKELPHTYKNKQKYNTYLVSCLYEMALASVLWSCTVVLQ